MESYDLELFWWTYSNMVNMFHYRENPIGLFNDSTIFCVHSFVKFIMRGSFYDRIYGITILCVYELCAAYHDAIFLLNGHIYAFIYFRMKIIRSKEYRRCHCLDGMIHGSTMKLGNSIGSYCIDVVRLAI